MKPLFVQIDGVAIADSDVSTTVLPSGGAWDSTSLLEVVLSGNFGYADDTDIKLTILSSQFLYLAIRRSNRINGGEIE